MTPEANQDVEEQSTGGSATVEQKQNDAAASAPAQAAETPIEQPQTPATPSEAPVTGQESASTSTAPEAARTDEPQPAGDVDFGAILEQFEQDQTIFHSGELVTGTIVGVSERGALVDFGYKSEGIIQSEELENAPLNVGDTVEAIIKHIGGDSAPILSRSDAIGRKVWNDIEEAYKNETPVVGKIVDKTKGGLKVDLNGIEAFLPGSQIDSRPIRGLDTYIGEEIEAKIIKFSRRRNNIVLSRKVITDVVLNEQKQKTLEDIDVGFIVDGVVKNITEYGAFVDIGGIDGLLHVTDMSWGRVGHPSDMFKPNDHVQLKVLKLDREKEKVSLGYKQLQPDPWSTVIEMYPVNSRVKGKVSTVADYGVFVELEPGVEGLVHVSEISWAKRSASPKKMFNRGDEVEVQILGVDTVEKRVSLGLKQLQENPWDTIAQRYPVGTKVHGKVRNLTDFGAFVEIEDGIDGLVHVSDITWAKKLKHPKELLKKDQEVDAVVTHIDAGGQRLSLSMKDLTPSAWESFVATHRPGDVVRGKVSRFTSFGVFIELGEGLEGLCHISELSEERVEKPEDVVQLGQELDFKILRIENDDQKIGLSYRAVGKDEPIVDTRQFSSEAKGGMASLGELANLIKPEPAEQPKPEVSKEEKDEAKRRKKEQARREYEQSAAQEAATEGPGGGSDDAAAETLEPVSETPPDTADSAASEETGSESETAAESPAPSETPADVSENSVAEEASPLSDDSSSEDSEQRAA